MRYTAIVVGNDGSESALQPVEQAAEIAAALSARLIAMCASHPLTAKQQSILTAAVGPNSMYQVAGTDAAKEALAAARQRAVDAGASDVSVTLVIDERRTALREGPGQRRPGRASVLRSLLNRLPTFYWPEPDIRRSLRRSEDAYRVLEDARVVVARGWVQDRWFARAQGSGASGGLNDVTAACLVGAVVYAVRQRASSDDHLEAGPALDYLWDAWQESRGLGGTGVAGWVAPRELRAVRVRDLTRWNDQPGRTRDEVLGLLDLATGRAFMAAMSAPTDPPVWAQRRKFIAGKAGPVSRCDGDVPGGVHDD